MSDQKQYICTKSWPRNTVGDLLTEWQYNKLPNGIKETHFKLVEPPVASVKDVAIIVQNEQIPDVEPVIEQLPYVEEQTVQGYNAPEPNTKVENDIRPVKRHRLYQGAVGTTEPTGSQGVAAVYGQ